MTQLYAQPYDISAQGFYFDTAEEYTKKSAKNFNSYGQFVEEYEIQFIDGDDIDAQLFEALGINQCNFSKFFEACNDWDEDQKHKTIIAVGSCGYTFDLNSDDPDGFDIDIYEVSTLRDLAEQFIEEGLFGEIPAALQNYLDYDAIARDLGADYSEITIAGTSLVYRCS
jgi:hypothetical protein